MSFLRQFVFDLGWPSVACIQCTVFVAPVILNALGDAPVEVVANRIGAGRLTRPAVVSQVNFAMQCFQGGTMLCPMGGRVFIVLTHPHENSVPFAT